MSWTGATLACVQVALLSTYAGFLFLSAGDFSFAKRANNYTNFRSKISVELGVCCVSNKWSDLFDFCYDSSHG